jgi:hypothetical protein
MNTTEEPAEELSPEEAAYLAHAQENLQRDGDLEFDDNAKVSISEDGGAYVQGWKWIDRSDLGDKLTNEEE